MNKQLQELIDEAKVMTHAIYFSGIKEVVVSDLMGEFVNIAFVAGARAHAEATRLKKPYIVSQSMDSCYRADGYKNAVEHQQELSDDFFANLNI